MQRGIGEWAGRRTAEGRGASYRVRGRGVVQAGRRTSGEGGGRGPTSGLGRVDRQSSDDPELFADVREMRGVNTTLLYWHSMMQIVTGGLLD